MKRIVNIGQFEGLIHAILSWKLTIFILDAQNKYAAGAATNSMVLGKYRHRSM